MSIIEMIIEYLWNNAIGIFSLYLTIKSINKANKVNKVNTANDINK